MLPVVCPCGLEARPWPSVARWLCPRGHVVRWCVSLGRYVSWDARIPAPVPDGGGIVTADLVEMSERWAVDYWRLWVELSRYQNRHASIRPAGRGPRPPAIVPATPLIHALRSDQLTAKDGTRRARLISWRTSGYLTVRHAEKVCDEYGLRPEIVWGARWHAVTALMAEGLVK